MCTGVSYNFYAKVPRERVRNLGFVCKSTEEERWQSHICMQKCRGREYAVGADVSKGKSAEEESVRNTDEIGPNLDHGRNVTDGRTSIELSIG